MIELDIDPSEIDYIKNLMDAYPDIVQKATMRALKRVMVTLRQATAKEVSERYKISVVKGRAGMKIITARQGRFQAQLDVDGYKLGLEYFKPKQVKEGVVAEIMNGRKWLLKGFFLFQKSGMPIPIAVKRKEASRFPLKKAYGPSISDSITDETQSRLLNGLRERYLKEFTGQMSYLSGGSI